MYIELDAGCQEVPEAICPIHITFFSLAAPMLTPISLPDMTNNEPLFVGPFISPIEPGEGLAVGTGIFISIRGEGEGVGLLMPGMSGIAAAEGDGEGVGDGTGFCDCLSFPGGWPGCCPRTASTFAKTRTATNAAT